MKHYHRDEEGLLVRCFHQCRHWLSPPFLVGWLFGLTLSFGPEHFLWEKVWPFYLFTSWMEHQATAPLWFSAIILVGFAIAAVVAIHYVLRRD